MLSLPTDPTLHAAIDVADLAKMRRADVPSMPQAVRSAAQYMAEHRAVRRVRSICCKADGSLILISVGPLGGYKVLWRFGDLTDLPA